MSETATERERRSYVEKNARRRQFYDRRKPEHREARRRRREVGGAFGNAVDSRDFTPGTIRGSAA